MSSPNVTPDDVSSKSDSVQVKNEPSESTDESGVVLAQRAGLSRFLLNTYAMVSDKATDKYVGWNEEGNAIIMHKLHEFSEVVLPMYFNHSNYASFVRQLNMYGFRRAKSDAQGAFAHPLFLRGHPENLAYIKRKHSALKSKVNEEVVTAQRTALNELLQEVADLKEKQENFVKEVFHLKSKNQHLDAENVALWETMKEAKERQSVVESKLGMLLKFAAYLIKKEGDALPNIAKTFLPQVMASASDSKLDIDMDNPQHPATLFSPSTKADEEDNSLVRLHSLNSVPSFSEDNNVYNRLFHQDYTAPGDSTKNVPAQTLTPTPSGLDALITSRNVPSTTSPRGPTIDLDPGVDASDRALVMNDNNAAGLGSGADFGGNLEKLGGSSSLASLKYPPAETLKRNSSLNAFISSTQSGKPPVTQEYNHVARDLSQLINDQDNTFRRLHSLSSTISDDHDDSFPQTHQLQLEGGTASPLGDTGGSLLFPLEKDNEQNDGKRGVAERDSISHDQTNSLHESKRAKTVEGIDEV
eukprot:CAMPEP_0184524982 /NCGR_PEP_ID=MMETSP0198_2-20121128/9834_1 /TAXON_ID=1112570 /ORGANISM="Thraustochytrium sp., Strain LLF1b" /LENGTH=526 /DNA_ID=CAMNT_0026916369 /DNA_START=63 /DNA_END=1643 /DNA_ORIENTATION=-